MQIRNNSEWNWRLKDHIHVHTSLWDLLVFDFPWLFCRTLLQASRGELRCSGSCSRLRSAGEWVEPLHQGLQKSRGEKKSRGGGKRGKEKNRKRGLSGNRIDTGIWCGGGTHWIAEVTKGKLGRLRQSSDIRYDIRTALGYEVGWVYRNTVKSIWDAVKNEVLTHFLDSWNTNAKSSITIQRRCQTE